jgi:hypothetical protein
MFMFSRLRRRSVAEKVTVRILHRINQSAVYIVNVIR